MPSYYTLYVDDMNHMSLITSFSNYQLLVNLAAYMSTPSTFSFTHHSDPNHTYNFLYN